MVDKQLQKQSETYHLSLNREGRWGTADDFTTSFLHFSLFSTAPWDMPNSRPVHSLMLSSHLFLCPHCLLPLSLCIALWFWPDLMNGRHDHTLQSASLYDRQKVFLWSNCLLGLGKGSSLVTRSLHEMRSILR